MQELYLSSKAFITITTGNEESDISNLIKHQKVICLFTDKTKEDINNIFNTSKEKIDDDKLIWTYYKNKDSFPCSGFMMKEALKNNEPITRFSRSIILLGKEEKDLESKIKEYGVKCIIYEDNNQDLKKGKSLFFENKDSGSWKDIISKVTPMPCNTIIINDHYIYSNDKVKNGINNLCAIIQEFSTNIRYLKIPFHILIIYAYAEKDFENLAKATVTSLKEALNNSKYVIEFIYCNDKQRGKYDLYKHTHDRFVISNYTAIDASHALDLFNKDGSIKTEQKVTIGNLLYENTLKMNDTFIKHIAREIEKGFEDPDNPYLYLKYEHLKDNSPEPNNCIKDIQNRLILDELSLIEGEAYSYINVPCNELEKMECVNKQRYEGADKCKNRIIARQGEAKTLSDIINNIKKCFRDRSLEICEQEHYFKIVTTSPQDLKTIHVIASCNDSKNQCNLYNFNDAEKAMRMCNKIASILCIESKYSEEDITMINREYLFKPHKPESFQTEDKKPLFNKRVLVIGTSHYCPHDSCNDYVYCTNNATSSGYSKIHKENTGCKQGFPLEKATQNLITSFIGESLNDKEQDRDYTSLSIFSNFMIEYFKKKGEYVSSKYFWEHVAFVNYAQNFESRKETTYFSPNDFEAFKKYLDEIKPDVVIVWGSELGEELRKNLKVQPSEQNETNGNSILYYWKGTGEYEKIEFLNCHHPYNNSEKFMSDENFSNALNKIFNPKGDAGEPQS